MSLGKKAIKLQDVLETKMFIAYLTVVYCLQDSYPATGTWTDYCSKTPSHNGTFPPLCNNPGIAYCTSMIEHRTAVGPQGRLQLKDKHVRISNTVKMRGAWGEERRSLAPASARDLDFGRSRARERRERSWKRVWRATFHLDCRGELVQNVMLSRIRLAQMTSTCIRLHLLF